MKALISPNEDVMVPSLMDGIVVFTPTKARVADKAEVAFEVAEPLFWVDCAADLDRDMCYYDMTAQQIVTFTIPEVTHTQIPSTDLGAPAA